MKEKPRQHLTNRVYLMWQVFRRNGRVETVKLQECAEYTCAGRQWGSSLNSGVMNDSIGRVAFGPDLEPRRELVMKVITAYQ